jgi:hypothetical protein
MTPGCPSGENAGGDRVQGRDERSVDEDQR